MNIEKWHAAKMAEDPEYAAEFRQAEAEDAFTSAVRTTYGPDAIEPPPCPSPSNCTCAVALPHPEPANR